MRWGWWKKSWGSGGQLFWTPSPPPPPNPIPVARDGLSSPFGYGLVNEQVRDGDEVGPGDGAGAAQVRGLAGLRLASPLTQASPALSRGSSLLFPSPAQSSILADVSLEEAGTGDEDDEEEELGVDGDRDGPRLARPLFPPTSPAPPASPPPPPPQASPAPGGPQPGAGGTPPPGGGQPDPGRAVRNRCPACDGWLRTVPDPLRCSSCDTEYHKKCSGLTQQGLKRWAQSRSWQCPPCDKRRDQVPTNQP